MAITNTQRDKLVELYIAYFNRAPEAGGLTYWSNVLSDKLAAGQSEASAMTDISNQFYAAGVQYSEVTGYSATMTDAAFVTKIYENVLGRTGSLAPNAQEVNYWVTAMNGTNPAETGVTRATVIQRMISDAKEFATVHSSPFHSMETTRRPVSTSPPAERVSRASDWSSASASSFSPERSTSPMTAPLPPVFSTGQSAIMSSIPTRSIAPVNRDISDSSVSSAGRVSSDAK